jgi:FeS assembly SUF system protein
MGDTDTIDYERVHQGVVDAMRGIYDPEIPVNIYDLGLVYAIEVGENGHVDIKMTLTSPSCPEAQSLPPMVEAEARTVEGVRTATVEVVWDPPWGPERMSEAAKLQLGFDL